MVAFVVFILTNAGLHLVMLGFTAGEGPIPLDLAIARSAGLIALSIVVGFFYRVLENRQV